MAVEASGMFARTHRRKFSFEGRMVRRVALGTLLVVIILLAFARWNLRRGVHVEIERIHAGGQPVTLVELQQLHRDNGVRRDSSAALSNALASVNEQRERFFTNGIPGSSLQWRDLPLVGQGTQIPPDRRIDSNLTNAISLAFAEIGPALNELSRVIGTPDDDALWFPLELTNGVSLLLWHLSPLKSISKWYALRSAISQDQGHTDAAIASIIDALHLSRTLETEPVYISQLVRFSMLKITMASAERLVSRCVLSRSQLKLLRKELSVARPHQAMHLAMVGERCSVLDFMYFRPGDPLDLDGPRAGNHLRRALSRGAILLYRMTGLADVETLSFLSILETCVATGTNAVTARVALANSPTAFDPQSRGGFSVLLEKFVPRLGKGFQSEADCLTAIVATDTVLAVEEFRAEHGGKLPTSLAELVPAHCVSVPTDPATGKPFFVVPSGPGYAIHSGAGAPVSTIRR